MMPEEALKHLEKTILIDVKRNRRQVTRSCRLTRLAGTWYKISRIIVFVPRQRLIEGIGQRDNRAWAIKRRNTCGRFGQMLPLLWHIGIWIIILRDRRQITRSRR